jgi:ribosome biogenesis GTPase
MGLDKDFSLRRMERYLVLAAESQASPVVFLTKAGVAEDVEAKLKSAQSMAQAVPVHAIDVLADLGIDAPWRYLSVGSTAALVGSSGAGKSTLANHLLGADVQLTGLVRAHDDRGKHTTSRRELFVLGRGGIVIDTPGLRELSMWADADSFANAFDDVTSLALGCRFSNCAHNEEPGCRVREAIAAGQLQEERLASFRQLEGELRAGGRTSTRPDRHSSRTKREDVSSRRPLRKG